MLTRHKFRIFWKFQVDLFLLRQRRLVIIHRNILHHAVKVHLTHDTPRVVRIIQRPVERAVFREVQFLYHGI